MADGKECHFWQVGCKLENAAQDQITEFVKSTAQAGLEFLKVVNSFWLNAPSPEVKDNPIIQSLQADIRWYTLAFAVIGVLFAIGKIGFSRNFRAGGNGMKMIIHLVLVTGVSATLVATMITAADDFSPWIVDRVTGKGLDLTQALSVNLIMTPGIGPGMLMALLGFLGSLANLALMIVRDVVVSLLFVFLPTLAASSESEMGAQAYRKAQGWLWAFVLYKPVAAIIYAYGLLALQGTAIKDLDDVGTALMQTTSGVACLLMAGLALPAMIKAIVPAAANGVSGVFSGGAVAAAAIATGAAIATFGGSAAAGGAAAAAGTTGASTGTATAGEATKALGATASPSVGGGGGTGPSGPSGTSGSGGPSGGTGPNSSGSGTGRRESNTAAPSGSTPAASGSSTTPSTGGNGSAPSGASTTSGGKADALSSIADVAAAGAAIAASAPGGDE